MYCPSIIGEEEIGNTIVAIDTILNHNIQSVICLYVAIGQKYSSRFSSN